MAKRIRLTKKLTKSIVTNTTASLGGAAKAQIGSKIRETLYPDAKKLTKAQQGKLDRFTQNIYNEYKQGKAEQQQQQQQRQKERAKVRRKELSEERKAAAPPPQPKEKKKRKPGAKKYDNLFLGERKEIETLIKKTKPGKIVVQPFNKDAKSINYNSDTPYFFALDKFNSIIKGKVFSGVKKIFLPNGQSFDRSKIKELQNILRTDIRILNRIKNKSNYAYLDFQITGNEMYITLNYPDAAKYNFTSPTLSQ